MGYIKRTDVCLSWEIQGQDNVLALGFQEKNLGSMTRDQEETVFLLLSWEHKDITRVGYFGIRGPQVHFSVCCPWSRDCMHMLWIPQLYNINHVTYVDILVKRSFSWWQMMVPTLVKLLLNHSYSLVYHVESLISGEQRQ